MTTRIITSIHNSCMKDAAKIFNSIKPHHGRADIIICGIEKKAYRFVFYRDSGSVFIKPVTINRKLNQKEEYIILRKDVKSRILHKIIEECPDISKDTVDKLYIYLLQVLSCLKTIMYPKTKQD